MNLITPPTALSDAAVPGGPVYLVPPGFSGTTPAPHSPTVIEAINAERATAGLPPLAFDAGLSGAAQYWSVWQARKNLMTHGPGTSFAARIWTVCPGAYVGEVVGSGYPDVASVVAGWMASPPHREIIMDGRFTKAGAGKAFGRDGTSYWTADFAS